MKTKLQLLIFLSGWLLLSKASVYAQGILDTRITIKSSQERVDQVLSKIERLGGFSFSYSPDAIDVRRKVSVAADEERIVDILDKIFQQEVQYKVRRRYVILQKRAVPKAAKVEEDFNFSGYIVDGATGEKLANASVYESSTLISTISNQYGYYKLRLPNVSSKLQLEVRKEEYVGVSIPVMQREDTYRPILLSPDTLRPLAGKPARLSQRIDSVGVKVVVPEYETTATASSNPLQGIEPVLDKTHQKLRQTYQFVQGEFVSAFASAQQHIHTRNIEDTLYRPFQASLLPFLGTNHGLSGNVVNDFSLNLLAGYSLGVNAMEIGWGINAVRGNVKGFQLAGLSNVVGNNVTGFQFASVLNVTLGDVYGFQGSNVINYTGKNFRGWQVAGIGNVVVGHLNGYQLSPVYNFAGTVRSGHQIGMVNFADSSATVPFGMFSYVRRNGYRRYEVSIDEFNYFNATFKTGMPKFYNVFTMSFNGLAAHRPIGSMGYGFGTARLWGRGWGANLDLTANAVWLDDRYEESAIAGLFRASLSIERKIAGRFALAAGPTLNLFVSDYMGVVTNKRKIEPIWIGHAPSEGREEQSWLGFAVALRFCNK
ncbi:hypothetical protein CLV98_108172 [Dyadobacter jejuensis]|uniref:Carboxypeptidase-like protein n=1 Tax=Dyadobacter jejuensis TaxID=1082580 RepID=A0A316AHU1_9BACT|nr:STN and carboxypeptidase regulatory-like domain-containing protein [Dyadobacter jejuensis]PWJ57252.1 hypothetical protein CLV98_108172 [Dyadobacter jejuensis]